MDLRIARDAETDADLLARVAAGDIAAVGDLYDRFAPLLFPMARRILRSGEEAEDALHDAFVNVADRAGQFVPGRGSVAAWLVLLVRNLSIDRVRQRRRRGRLERERIAHEHSPATPTPERLAAGGEDRARILRALEGLPAAQRMTLESAFFEGLSYPEIAARDGVPVGTIKSRVRRALASLETVFAREERGSVRASDGE